MERFTSYETFLAFCQKNKVPHRFDNENQLVELPNTATPLPPTTIIKFDKKLPLIMFVQFMAANIPENRIQDLEAAISRLNTLLEINGYCIDYEQSRLLCRFSIPIFSEGVSAVGFQRTFEMVVVNAQRMLPVLVKVIEGAPGKDVYQILRDLFGAKAAGSTAGSTVGATPGATPDSTADSTADSTPDSTIVS